MSGLGSLFSGFSANADSNDALKYSAPKEPKAKASKANVAAPATVSTPTPAATSPVPAQTAKAPGPSKIMSAASVRLYKVNPSTGAYDAVENGGLLGCVMMGTNTTFQILVYNAQKVPQATVAVGAGFDFAIRDQYMSFSDSAGNQWSLLFDAPEVMTNFVRTVAATVVHMVAHTGDAEGGSVVRRHLPRAPGAEGEDAVLGAGMSAGLYLTAWELQEAADYPGDILAGTVLKRIQAPEEVLKVKVSSADEVIGGLGEVLVGLRKGDRCLVGLPPKVFYRGGAEGPIDPAKRAFPGSWLLLEVEVAKIKSGDSKGTKKDKAGSRKEDEPPAPAPAPAPVPDSPAQRLAKRNNSASSADDQPNQGQGGGADIAARMARVAAGGGGGGAGAQLAGIMNPGHQRSPESSRPGNGSTGRGRDGGYRDDSIDEQQYHPQPRQQQQQQQYQNQNQHQQSHYDQRREPQQSYVENRLAVVEGQGVRSFYTDTGEEDPSYYQPQQRQPQPAYTAAPSRFEQQQTAASLNTLHQSVAAVQQSMLQLHTKLDQVGSQVATSAALQQQQQAMVAMGMGGMGTMGMGGGMMPGMSGMGGYMNPLQQQQQLMFQQQQQQMQMQQQQAVGTATPSAARLKTEELVGTLQALLAEFEKGASAGGKGDKEREAAERESKEALRALRATVEKVEEKNDTLQAKYDKVMGEKAEVMEKYMESFQSVSAATSKLYQAQQEAEALRQGKAELQRELDALRAASAGNTANEAAAREKDQAHKAEVAELQHKVMSLQVEAMELKQALEVAKASGVGASAQLQGQLDASVADCAQLRAEAQALRQERAALQVDLAALESKSAQQAADFERRLSEAQASGAGAASAELDSLRAKLASAENEVASLNQALESVAAKAVETAEQHEKEVKALQQQLAAASAAAAQASSDGGRADAEELKAIMQDVFVKAGEVFDTEGPDSAEAQYSALDVVKRLKGVLKKVTAERSASV